MTVRYANALDLYLLPAPTSGDPTKVGGAIQVLLGAWLDVDLTTLDNGWLRATDRSGRSGWIRQDALREDTPLKVFYLDVGQGDAAVIETSSGLVIIDGGPNRGLRDWLLEHYAPVIAESPTHQLEISAVVVTHFDQDHFWGIKSLLERNEFTIERLFHNGLPRYDSGANFDLDLGTISPGSQISTDLDDLASAGALHASGTLATNFGKFIKAALDAHEAGRLGRMERLYRRDLSTPPPRLPDFVANEPRIEVLAPVPANQSGPVRLPVFSDAHSGDTSASESHTVNGNSVVLALTYGEHRFLFGGDLNQPAQHYLLDRYAPENPFAADVNKACHHGSADFDLAFLDAASPMATVFSSGDDGKYDHPMPEAIGAAARHSRGSIPLIFSTELARETGSGGIHFGHINARSNGETLIMAQKKEFPTAKKTWYSYPLPFTGS